MPSLNATDLLHPPGYLKSHYLGAKSADSAWVCKETLEESILNTWLITLQFFVRIAEHSIGL